MYDAYALYLYRVVYCKTQTEKRKKTRKTKTNTKNTTNIKDTSYKMLHNNEIKLKFKYKYIN